MNNQEYLDLVKKVNDGSATDYEIALYNEWYNSLQGKDFRWDEKQLGTKENIEKILFQRIEKKIDQKSKKTKVIRYRFWPIAIASSVLIMTFTVLFFYAKSDMKSSHYVIVNDIDPGGEKATLTLADGSVINLEDQEIGEINNENFATITKNENGQIIYQAKDAHLDEQALTYHTISTPLGGKYKIVLADGTQVWLNASSSLHFPTSFAAQERVVSIVGEAFFEVAKEADRPFKVQCGNQVIEVLGTQFNVNAYQNESNIKTTLTEGSVNIIVENSEKTIKPGEQFVLDKEGKTSVNKVNIDQVVAWKQDVFHFWKTDIRDIMKQLARWYDIEVVFEGSTKSEYITGFISRNVSISNVLRMLEETGDIKFRVEGNLVTVYIP